MGTRGANRDAMVQHLEDDTWVDTLISEAYADAWAGPRGEAERIVTEAEAEKVIKGPGA